VAGERPDRRTVAAGLAAAAVAAACFVLGPRAWLGAAVLCVAAPAGAVLLLATARLTPGRWRDGLGPSLAALAGTWPAGALAMAPILAVPGLVYPWVAHPGSGFRQVWLSQPFFLLRGVAWLALTAWLARRTRAGRLDAGTAARGLVVWTPLASLIAVDWLLSLDPRSASSGFGLYLIAFEADLACALATALAARGDLDERARDVLGGVLFSVTAIWAYLGFMQYLIVWSGDLPAAAAWMKAHEAWAAAAWLAVGLKLAPGAVLVMGRIRRSPRALARVAWCVALGAVPEAAWLALPARAGAGDVALFLLAVAALGLLAAGLAGLPRGAVEAVP
jgi:hypothetical protein